MSTRAQFRPLKGQDGPQTQLAVQPTKWLHPETLPFLRRFARRDQLVCFDLLFGRSSDINKHIQGVLREATDQAHELSEYSFRGGKATDLVKRVRATRGEMQLLFRWMDEKMFNAYAHA